MIWREAWHSLVVAVCLITTIVLISQLDQLDGRAFWLTLGGAAVTNAVVTHFIVSGRQPRSRKGNHRKVEQ